MDHERRYDRDERSEPPSEGVRIIGAEEAAEALERGDVVPRRNEGEPKFGDRPNPPPTGPRPVLRFPLGQGAEPISEPVELPHWTQPPTGQVPQILPDPPGGGRQEEDWAGFATSTPRWRDEDDAYPEPGEHDPWVEDEPLGALDDSERPSHDDFFSFADLEESAPSRSVFADVEEEPLAAWDDTPGYLGEPEPYEEPPTRRVATGQRVGRAASTTGSHRAVRPFERSGGRGGGDRDLAQAAVVGIGLLVVLLGLFKVGTAATMVLVLAVIGMATVELYTVLRQAGYHPLVIPGAAGAVGLVLAAYNYGGEEAPNVKHAFTFAGYPTVLFLTVAVCMLWYLVGAGGDNPVISIGLTLLGVMWIGMFGSFAGLMLSLGKPGEGILFAAIIGTVGYDVGGLFIGQNAGRSPLSAASPNKTIEGLVGGCVVAFVVVVLLSAVPGMGPIDKVSEGALVGFVVAIAAPLGDLCQSVLKRDLGVKDMGSILPGHGGLLDRFDGLLFVLPSVWLLTVLRTFFG
jgi:phosphatidate cytidylyltransferase